MRLYNICYLCELYIPVITKTMISEVKNGSSIIGYDIKNWPECKTALETLVKIPCLEERARAVYESINAIDRDSKIPRVSKVASDTYNRTKRDLLISMQTLVELQKSLEMGQAQSGIDIKMPVCHTLKEYIDCMKDIDFIFSQCPYLLFKDEEVKFNNVDVGSTWLTFIVITAGGFYILNNLAKLVDKAIAIKSNLVLLREQEEQLEARKLKNEITQETIDVFKQMKKSLMENAVADLESELGTLKDGEERGKVEKSLEKLSFLIEKGTQIYSSIETPNEIKTLFPFAEDNAILPDNVLKLLEMKAEEK